MRIVFCGNTFPDATHVLRRSLPDGVDDEIIVWPGDCLKNMPGNVDVLIPKMHPIDSKLLKLSGCRLVQQWGVGLEGVDLQAADLLGIPVANVPAGGGNADSVAEHAILLILALLRKLNHAQRCIREGVLGSPSGEALSGRTVCLYGLGTIALPLAKILRSFGVKLIGLTRTPDTSKSAEYGLAHCYTLEQKEICLQQTDILIICAKLSSETRNSIGSHELANLPKGALVINVARGGIVEEHALTNALSIGHLGGAGLDVFWREPIEITHPLLQMENVIATPHIAGITFQSLHDISRGVVENINRLRLGAPLLSVRNLRSLRSLQNLE